MPWRPHPKMAETDASYPRCWGTCQRCGFIGNLVDLRWQLDWAGTRLQNLKLLVCEPCLDDPSEAARRTIVLPPDPPFVADVRPEQYAIEEGLVAAFTASIADVVMTVSAITSGAVSTGATIVAGAAAGTIITKQLTGPNPPGGTGTYQVSISQTVSSTPMTTD